MVQRIGVWYQITSKTDAENNVVKDGIIICDLALKNVNGLTTNNGYYF